MGAACEIHRRGLSGAERGAEVGVGTGPYNYRKTPVSWLGSADPPPPDHQQRPSRPSHLISQALQLAKQQPYPQSRAFAHTATPIPAPPAVLWQPLPKMQPQGPALRRPPGPPSPHVALPSDPAASVPEPRPWSQAQQGSREHHITVDTTEPPMAPPRQGSRFPHPPTGLASGLCHTLSTLAFLQPAFPGSGGGENGRHEQAPSVSTIHFCCCGVPKTRLPRHNTTRQGTQRWGPWGEQPRPGWHPLLTLPHSVQPLAMLLFLGPVTSLLPLLDLRQTPLWLSSRSALTR